MISVRYRYGNDDLTTVTQPEAPAVGDEVIVPGHAIPAWTVIGRRWYLPGRDDGPGQVLIEAWVTPA